MNTQRLIDNFQSLVEQEGVVTERFYEILFKRYPQAKKLFGRKAQTAQAKMLQETLVSVLEHIEDGDWLTENLEAMGATHVDYGVTDAMYPWVGECLIAALAAASGDAWDEELEQSWTEAYTFIATQMKQGARKYRPVATES